MTSALTVGIPIQLQLVAYGGTPPYTYAIVSGLPAGLSLNAATGLVTGTPTTVQSSTALVWSVEDSATPTPGTATDTFLVVVQAVPVAVPFYSFPVASAGRWRLRGAFKVVGESDTVDVAITGSPMAMAAVLTSGAPPSGDADADAYIALLGGTYSGAEEDAIDAFVVALKGRTLSDGGSQWASLTEFWICSLDNSTDALLGLKGNFALQTQNAPTFTAREGFKLNGSTQSLFSAINPSVRSSVERGVAGAYTRLGSTNSGVIFSADSTFLRHFGNGSGVYGGILGADLYEEPTGTYNGSATVTLNATDIVLCLNQTAFSEESGGFAPPDEPDVRWGRYDSETFSSASDDQFAACWVGFEGKGWTTAETQAFHADVETLLDVFGAGVIP